MAKGKQGYKARKDESLGMRTGAESGKKQSMKARRDESYGDWGTRTEGYGHGGEIENISSEEWFKNETTPKFVNTNKWVDETPKPDMKRT